METKKDDRKNYSLKNLIVYESKVQQSLKLCPERIYDSIGDYLEGFLRQNWPMFEGNRLGFPVSFSIRENDSVKNEAEEKKFKQLANRHATQGLQEAEKDLLESWRTFFNLRKLFRRMREREILSPYCVLPNELLPWFVLAMPVWYVKFNKHGNQNYFMLEIIERLKTYELVLWYQIWNRERLFSQYKGDVIPTHLFDIMEVSAEVFDYLAITTPYYEVAVDEWNGKIKQQEEERRLATMRHSDPCLLAFSKRLPFNFFFLGRWSDTGFFSSAREMVEQSIKCLVEHKNTVKKMLGRGFWNPEGKRWSPKDNNKLDGLDRTIRRILAQIEENPKITLRS